MTDNKDSPGKSLDLIQVTIGDFGRWQLMRFMTLSFMELVLAWKILSIVFLAPPAKFKCISAPNATADQCYSVTGEECTEWEYDRSVFEETIITEWNLVCGQAPLANVAQTIFMGGVLLGSFFLGMASDRFGRKVPLYLAIVLQVAAGIATAFVPSFELLLVCRLFDAIAVGGQLTIGFVLCMESMTPKHRTLMGVLYKNAFCIGQCAQPLFAYYLRTWRYFQLGISIFPIVYLPYWWIIIESPRWLMTRGREEEAVAILESAAIMNKMDAAQVAPNVRKWREQATAQQRPNSTVLDLMRTPNMRIKSICVFIIWLVCGVGLYGLNQYISQIGGDIFINVLITGLIAIPGSALCLYFMQRFGRKPTLAISMFVSGVFCLLIMAVPLEPGSEEWPKVVMSTLGLLGMNVAFPTGYVYTVEVFPTVVRNVGMGASSLTSRVGSMVAPFVSSLGSISPYYPPIVFGILPVLGSTACFFLPETVNSILPDTLEDGERINRKSKPIPKPKELPSVEEPERF